MGKKFKWEGEKKKGKKKRGRGKEKGENKKGEKRKKKVMGRKGKEKSQKTDKNKSLPCIMKGKHIYFFNFQNEKTNLIIVKYNFNISFTIKVHKLQFVHF